MAGLPPGIRLIQSVTGKAKQSSLIYYQGFIWIITFLTYAAYHASRRPIAIVRNAQSFLNCDLIELYNNTGKDNHTHHLTEEFCISFIDEMDHVDAVTAKGYLSAMGVTAYLVSYAVFMFFSGFLCERMDQRYFLSIGCLLSGGFTFLFGLAYSTGIHSIWYFIIIQVILGAMQSTGWPGVVSVMANWFGKGKRGLIFGIWNAHTSIGNIVGTAMSAAFLTKQWDDDWGLSFIFPGLFIGCVGFLLFLFLIPSPDLIGLEPPQQHDPKTEIEDPETIKAAEIKEPTNDKAIGFIGALKIPGVVEFSLCLFFAKLVSYVFLYQLPTFIHSTSGMNAENSGVLSEYFDWGGIIGGITAGILTDWSGMSGTTCSAMLVIATPLLFCYQTLVQDWCPITSDILGVPVQNSCYGWNIAMMILVGILVNGPYALITTAVSAELGNHKSLKGSSKALATVTAIIDGTGSIGAALGPTIGTALSPAHENGSWNLFFYMLMASDILALLMLARIVKHEIEDRIKQRKER